MSGSAPEEKIFRPGGSQHPRGSWHLAEADLRRWLEGLEARGSLLVMPVEEGGLLLYRAVTGRPAVPLGPRKAKWSPKEFLFPSCEPVYSFSVGGGHVELADPQSPAREMILWGLTPCDAAGLARLDSVFLGRGGDPFYEKRRSLATVVAMACTAAQPECFCTAVGGSPLGTEGCDIQIVPLDGSFLVRTCTARGDALVAAAGGDWNPALPEHWARTQELERTVAADISRAALSADRGVLLQSRFASPAWEALAWRCLGCGVCAFVCPSCSCFDLHHEARAWCGTACRTWDSCAFALFTRHASGHNPRPTQACRYRQRVLHKFAYFPQEHEGKLMCVGCGRCALLCPVGMDIHQSVEGFPHSEVKP